MIPVVDVWGGFAACCGDLGWAPDDYWNATLYEVRLALRGSHRERHSRLAKHATWILNGVRAAVWTKRWKDVAWTDLYDPTPQRTQEDLRREKDELVDILPSTL